MLWKPPFWKDLCDWRTELCSTTELRFSAFTKLRFQRRLRLWNLLLVVTGQVRITLEGGIIPTRWNIPSCILQPVSSTSYIYAEHVRKICRVRIISGMVLSIYKAWKLPNNFVWITIYRHFPNTIIPCVLPDYFRPTSTQVGQGLDLGIRLAMIQLRVVVLGFMAFYVQKHFYQ